MKIVRILRCLPCEETLTLTLEARDPRRLEPSIDPLIAAFRARHDGDACRLEQGDGGGSW